MRDRPALENDAEEKEMEITLETIEVTDEMIDAGLAAYAEWDSDDRTSSVVISIYRATAELAPRR